jgi:DNA-binding transcriptional regulator YiaG
MADEGDRKMTRPFSDRLKTARRKAKLTQSQAAKLAGVKLRTWQEWEQGRATPHRIVQQAALAAMKAQPQ